MDRPFRPLPFRKTLLLIFLVAGLVYVLLTTWINFWIGLHQEEFLTAMREGTDRSITVRQIQFRLPNRLFLKDVEFDTAFIKTVEIRFWMVLFPRPVLQLRSLSLTSPRFSFKTRLDELMKLGSLLPVPKSSFYHGLPIETRLYALRFWDGEVTVETENHQQHLNHVSADIFKKTLFRPERFSLEARLAEDPKAKVRLRGDIYQRDSHGKKMVLQFDCQKLGTAFLKPYLDKKLLLPPEEVTASIQIQLGEKGSFRSHGKIFFQRLLSEEGLEGRLYRLTGSKLLYRLKGKVGAGTLTLQEVALRSGKLKLKGKGVLRKEGDSYEFSLTSARMPLRQLQPLVPELTLDAGTAWISLTLGGQAERLTPHLILNIEDGAFRYPPFALTFSKVGGTLRLSKEGLAFGELWAFTNNLPIRITGELLHPGRPEFAFELVTYPGQLKSLRHQNPLNLSLTWKGSLEKKELFGTLMAERLLAKGPTGPEAVQRISCEGLRLEWRPLFLKQRRQITGQKSPLAAEKMSLTQTNFLGVTRQLVLDHVQGSYLLTPTSLKLHLLGAELWGGKVLGELTVDRQAPYQLNTSGKIHLVGLQLPQPLQLIERQYPITGSLDGEILWQGSKVNGQLVAADGSIGPSEMLDQFAQETGIEVVRIIPFKELSLHFTFDEEELEVTEFRLESDNIKFSGEWKVREELIGGRLGARFRQSAVRKSSDLKRLIRFVGGEEWIDFDFRIAGNSTLPRMQWLPGEFKKKVEHGLDPYLRKQLEKELEKLLLRPATPSPSSVSE